MGESALPSRRGRCAGSFPRLAARRPCVGIPAGSTRRPPAGRAWRKETSSRRSAHHPRRGDRLGWMTPGLILAGGDGWGLGADGRAVRRQGQRRPELAAALYGSSRWARGGRRGLSGSGPRGGSPWTPTSSARSRSRSCPRSRYRPPRAWRARRPVLPVRPARPGRSRVALPPGSVTGSSQGMDRSQGMVSRKLAVPRKGPAMAGRKPAAPRGRPVVARGSPAPGRPDSTPGRAERTPGAGGCIPAAAGAPCWQAPPSAWRCSPWR